MIALLKQYFSPTNIEEGYSLAISYGQKGARLTHNHERQYYYALQSLTLWREIANDMFKLWYLSEEDLLSTVSPYRLRDTGQGLNRVQQAPLVRRAMHALLFHCQEKIGHWYPPLHPMRTRTTRTTTHAHAHAPRTHSL
jgi:hypothetical protein